MSIMHKTISNNIYCCLAKYNTEYKANYNYVYICIIRHCDLTSTYILDTLLSGSVLIEVAGDVLLLCTVEESSVDSRVLLLIDSSSQSSS